MSVVWLRAFDAPDLQESLIDSTTVCYTLRFRVSTGCSRACLLGFLSVMEADRVAWKHLGSGVYRLLVPFCLDLPGFKKRLADNFGHVGHLVVFTDPPGPPPVPPTDPEASKFPSSSEPSPTRYNSWNLQVCPVYDSKDLSRLLHTCTSYGAWFKHQGGGLYEIRIPEGLSTGPFRETIEDCPAVQNVETEGQGAGREEGRSS